MPARASGPRASSALSASRPLADDETLVLVSIDTEEDNWVPTCQNVEVTNARELPRLHDFLARLGARPTYFVAHALAADPRSSPIVRELSERPGTEVGAHLHPWNTPPVDSGFVHRDTMMLNLPPAVQQAKLERLTMALQECLGGARPDAFRAGRWGIGTESIAVLLSCGYRVDSSVTPFTTWETHGDGPSHIGAPINAYRIVPGGSVTTPVPGGALIEVPASFGFNRAPLPVWGKVHQMLTTGVGRALQLDRIAGSTGLLRWVTLSPETDNVEDMLALSRALLAAGARHLHVYLHSPTLCPGLTPFVRSALELDQLYATLGEYLDRIGRATRIRFATVSEAAALMEPYMGAQQR